MVQSPVTGCCSLQRCGNPQDAKASKPPHARHKHGIFAQTESMSRFHGWLQPQINIIDTRGILSGSRGKSMASTQCHLSWHLQPGNHNILAHDGLTTKRRANLGRSTVSDFLIFNNLCMPSTTNHNQSGDHMSVSKLCWGETAGYSGMEPLPATTSMELVWLVANLQTSTRNMDRNVQSSSQMS